MPEWLANITVGQVSSVVVAAVVVVGFFWRVLPLLRKTARLIDDLTGAPERPGWERRPGLMERMRTIEDELSYGGRSLKDTVEETQKEVSELKISFDQHLAEHQPPTLHQDINVHPYPPSPA
jgi:hypothetical protein